MKPYRVSHIEIPVTDMNKAKEFFGTIFRWKDIIHQWNKEYLLVAGPEENQTSFGLFLADKIKQNDIIITIGVDNIDEILAQAKQLGGEVIKEKYEIAPEIGFAANFKDIFGNIWGLHMTPVKQA